MWCNQMAKIYVLKEPRREREWNIYALREAARLKKWFQGVYYSPKLKRLLAVFKPSPGTHVNLLVFEELGESIVRDSYRLICVKGCGRCCAMFSGAFILENEVQSLPSDMKAQVYMQPSELVRTPGGPVRVFSLATGPLGRCVFFDPDRCTCRIEEQASWKAKPIVCLLTYCTLFAEKNGKLYIKMGYRETRSGVEIFYREASREEVEALARRLSWRWRRGEAARRALEESAEGAAP